MGSTKFTKCFIFFALLLSGMIMSCQKDDDMKDVSAAVKIDSTLNASGNYLAVKGSLKITIQDSTYIFDAARDSIAFVNVHSGDSQYFGISSAGSAASNANTNVAGSQFLLSSGINPNIEYALTPNAASQDFGKISLISYKQDSVLAKGTFYTFLTKDSKVGAPFYKVKGTFSLQLK